VGHGTFEERVGQALDELYPGALFLAGGREDAAERLLVRTLRYAFRGFHGQPEGIDVDRWLEGLLAKEALGSGSSIDSEVGGPGSRSPLLVAAGLIPPRPRVALWLILFRRWSYSEAADALGADLDAIREYMVFRDSLISALMGRTRSGNGTDGVARS